MEAMSFHYAKQYSWKKAKKLEAISHPLAPLIKEEFYKKPTFANELHY